MSQTFVLSLSFFQILAVFFPIVLIAALNPSSFVRGGVVGLMILMVAQLIWRRRACKAQAQEKS